MYNESRVLTVTAGAQAVGGAVGHVAVLGFSNDRVFFRRPEDDDFDMEEELRKLHPQRPQRQLELEPRSRRGMVVDPRVSVIHEGDGGPGDSEESDSDGPILYRDDDEDEEDVPQGELLLKCG